MTYTGAGALPGYNPEVGLCTQFAILHVQTPSQAPEPVKLGANTVGQPYRLFSRIEYPIYEEQHSDSEVLQYLHEKIALVRPRLPEPFDETEDTGYYNETSVGHAGDGHDENSLPNPPDEPDKITTSNITPDNPSSDPSIELGVISLEDLWVILGVRQRCKTRTGLIRIINQSSLVRIEQETGLIRFDEDNSYWKEADRSLDAPLYQDDEPSPRGSDDGDWSESSFYKDEQDNFEEEDEVERKPYGLAYQHYSDQEEQQFDAPLEESGWSTWHDSPVNEHSQEWYSPK